MGTVTVDANSFEVYGDLAGAKVYVAGLVTAAATAWRALSDNEKSRTLVSARYQLDRITWQGTRNGSGGTTLEWPRDGVTDKYGAAVATNAVPDQVVEGGYELAVALAGNPAVFEQLDTGTNVKRLQATPVEVEFFAPTTGTSLALPLPKQVDDLVSQFYGSAASDYRSTASGLDGCSDFEDDDSYTRNGPF